MTKISEEFVKQQVENLKEEDDVEAVAAVGSYARNPDADHNDLDLFIIVGGNYRRRETVRAEGVVVEKLYNSMEWSREYLTQEEWWKNYRWYANAEIFYDPNNLFDELASYAEKIKDEKMELTDHHRKEISYYIWDFKQDIDSKDVAQRRYMMNQLFEYLLQKQYYLKNQVPVKRNYRLEKLKEFDGYMYKLAQEFLTSSSTLEKEQKLEKMIEHVTRSLEDISPEWKTDKEEM